MKRKNLLLTALISLPVFALAQANTSCKFQTQPKRVNPTTGQEEIFRFTSPGSTCLFESVAQKVEDLDKDKKRCMEAIADYHILRPLPPIYGVALECYKNHCCCKGSFGKDLGWVAGADKFGTQCTLHPPLNQSK